MASGPLTFIYFFQAADLDRARQIAAMSPAAILAWCMVVEGLVIGVLARVLWRSRNSSQEHERKLYDMLIQATRALDSQIRVLEKIPEESRDLRQFVQQSLNYLKGEIEGIKKEMDRVRERVTLDRPYGRERH